MPTIKDSTIKQKFVLFYFYFSFIAVVVVWATLAAIDFCCAVIFRIHFYIS